MAAAILALLSAAGFGVSDFFAGVLSRRLQPVRIALVAQVGGVLASLAVLGWAGGGGASTPALLWGALGGLGSGAGSLVLYRGLAVGNMSVIAPTSAVVTSGLPVLASLAGGERPSALALAGVLVSLPAVFLVAGGGAGTRQGARRGDVAYGAVAGAAFALQFVSLDRAGTGAGLWPIAAGQVVALAVLAGAAALRPAAGRPGLAVAWALPVGLLFTAADALFLAATGRGALAVVAVLASLYPAFTVGLAVAWLRERPTRAQAAGLVLASVGVAFLAAG